VSKNVIHQAQELINPLAFSVQLANALESDRLRYNEFRAALFDDFIEFLIDEYMAPGEFEECWQQFEKWNNNPTHQ